MHGLLSIQLLGILDTEAEEVAQFSGRIDLGLPSVLALTVHGQSHDIVSVLGRDKISRLQEDAGTVRERGRGPRLASLEGGVDGGLNISGGGVGVSGQRGVGSGARLGEGLGAADLFKALIRRVSMLVASINPPPCRQSPEER